MGKTRGKGGFSEVDYLVQGTPGLSEQGSARRELGNPVPPATVGEVMKLIRADLGEGEPKEPSPNADAATLKRALERAEDVARLARLLVVATLRAEAKRTKRWSGWTLREVWDAWLATGLNASGAVEGTLHLDKVLLTACSLKGGKGDPPTLGRANGAGPNGEHLYWVPTKKPVWVEGTGWMWRGKSTR